MCWSRRTFAKYLHTVSEAELRSWLKGQALPAWQAPCRKNLHGTCDVSGTRVVSKARKGRGTREAGWAQAPQAQGSGLAWEAAVEDGEGEGEGQEGERMAAYSAGFGGRRSERWALRPSCRQTCRSVGEC